MGHGPKGLYPLGAESNPPAPGVLALSPFFLLIQVQIHQNQLKTALHSKSMTERCVAGSIKMKSTEHPEV